MERKTYFFSMECVNTIDKHFDLANNLKHSTRSLRMISFNDAPPSINYRTLVIKIWTQLKLKMQEFCCKTLNIQNRGNWFFTKTTLKIMNRMINIIWEMMTKRFYVFEIKHTNWLKKSVRFESSIINDLNQMSKCIGIKGKHTGWFELGKKWFESWATLFESCAKIDSNQMPQHWRKII